MQNDRKLIKIYKEGELSFSEKIIPSSETFNAQNL